jgi:hypothetical protein
MSENAVLAALRSLDTNKEEMSGYGFRTMAQTILDEVLGVLPHELTHAVKDSLRQATIAPNISMNTTR